MIKQCFKLLVLLFALSMLLVACGEGEDEDPLHLDADGFVLKLDGREIYRQFQGTQSGGITLKVGEELDVGVVFLNYDSEEISFEGAEEHGHGHEEEEEDDHDEGEEHEEGDAHDEKEAYSLALSEYDASIIEIHLHEDEEGEEHEGEEHADEYVFEVTGLRAGQTGIKLQLMHEGHADFTAALNIPVTVSP